MNLTQVVIPQYNPATATGNYNPGRGGIAINSFTIHWIDGTLADADAVFTNPKTVHSAHFGVEDGNVHQYVKVSDTAFHAGIYSVNQSSIGIEHSAQPGRDASDATYETSSQLIVQIAKSLGKKVGDFTFKRHGDIVNTSCCGTVDVDRIKSRALAIEQEATLASATIVPVVTDFWVRLNYKVNIREEPTKASGIYATYPAKSEIECDGQVTGQGIDGNTTWYHTKLHGKYVTAAYSTIINQPKQA